MPKYSANNQLVTRDEVKQFTHKTVYEPYEGDEYVCSGMHQQSNKKATRLRMACQGFYRLL
ncbi:MAG TPA: hypothetical protein VEV83_20890 [Parafilimonas sp.]|nr:hypothetical protein [Parafilimonas sp.]